MSGRPWLEALKVTMKERSADTYETPEKIPESLLPEGCERCKSPTGELTPVVGTPFTRTTHTVWGEDEERLFDAGWTPKERGGLIIWENPESGFYYSQEVALHLLQRGMTL